MENNSKNVIQYDFMTKKKISYTSGGMFCIIPAGIDLTYISFDYTHSTCPEVPSDNNKYAVTNYSQVFDAVSNMFVGKFPVYSRYVKHTNTGTGYVQLNITNKYELFNKVDHEMYVCLTCMIYSQCYQSNNSDHACAKELSCSYAPTLLLLFKADVWTRMNTIDKFIRYPAIDNAVRHIDIEKYSDYRRTPLVAFQYVCEFTEKFTGLPFPFAV